MDAKHSDAGLENTRSIIIEGWMRMVLATGGIERFDDLHIDKIDPAWRGRESWVDGSSEAIDLAKELKTSIAPEKTLAIMCALTNDDSELVAPRSPNELSEQNRLDAAFAVFIRPRERTMGRLGNGQSDAHSPNVHWLQRVLRDGVQHKKGERASPDVCCRLLERFP
jgi:hypothetical protein